MSIDAIPFPDDADTDSATPDATAPDSHGAASLVPVRPRRDGWTPERQSVFLAVLAETGCVSHACATVGKSAQSAYRLRRRADAAAFDRARDQALVFASQRLTALAFERAINGVVEERLLPNGETIRARRYPHHLLIFLLRNFDPMRYGKLSGFVPFACPDPREEARTALDAFGLRVEDHADDAMDARRTGSAADIAPGCDA